MTLSIAPPRRATTHHFDSNSRRVGFHGRPVWQLGAADVKEFLNSLVAEGVSTSTHQQALCAIVFLFRHALELDMPWVDALERPKKKPHLPVVLSHDEVLRIFAELSGVQLLMAQLLYGSGLRLLECASLRIKDIDFELGQVHVRAGKGGKDRVTLQAIGRTGTVHD